MKKGQVVIFMIIGLLLLSSIIIILFLKSPKEEAQIIEIDKEINLYIESCLEQTIQDSIFDNSFTGGYLHIPQTSTTGLFYDVPYFYDDGVILVPTDEILAEEISKYVDLMLPHCLDFNLFEGYQVEITQPSSIAIITANRLSVETVMSTTITKGKTEKTIPGFQVDIPINDFYQNINTARIISESQEGEDICLTCFSNLAAKNDLFVNIIPTDDQTYLFEIEDNNYIMNEEPYMLRFAIRYNE